MTLEERMIKNLEKEVTRRLGSYSKPSQLRALLRDPNYFFTPRGAMRRKDSLTTNKGENHDKAVKD